MTWPFIGRPCATQLRNEGTRELELSYVNEPAVLMGRRKLSVLLLLVLPWLNGCLVRTRTLKQVKMPATVMTATAEDLITTINDRCGAIQSLSATVEFQASVGGPRKGKEKTYTSFNGYILLRKPESLRVIGLVPVLHTRAFDMASDGNVFKLWIPHDNKVIQGMDTATKESPNTLENFRPNVFSDSLLIKCIEPENLVTLTSSEQTKLDAKTKQLMVQANYDLTVLRRKGNSQELIPERVIHFNRADLHPFSEDIYDAKGAVQTQATYGPDQKFGTVTFPGTITIQRPLEEYQIVITIQKLVTNLKLTDDQFQLKTPAGATVQDLH
jgi:outer membrane lipoprotein-sorting protein